MLWIFCMLDWLSVAIVMSVAEGRCLAAWRRAAASALKGVFMILFGVGIEMCIEQLVSESKIPPEIPSAVLLPSV